MVRELVAGADLVVPSPGVRADHPASSPRPRPGVPVRSEIDLAAERARVPVVAVTGTNGKTHGHDAGRRDAERVGRARRSRPATSAGR